MGGCATKPKVEETTAPAPEKEVVVSEENATAVAAVVEEVSREIVVDGVEKVEEVEGGSRSRSLSNLLKEVVDEKEKAKPDDEQLAEPVKPDHTPEKPAELTEQEQQSTTEMEVLYEAEKTSVDSKFESQLKVAGIAGETKKLGDETEVHKLKTTAKTVDDATEVPKSEVLKPSEPKTVSTVVDVLKSETSKPSEASKPVVAAPEAPKPETSKPSEASKPVVAAPETPKTETSKPSEPAKTVNTVVVVPKSETIKPSEASKPVVAATSEAPKSGDPAPTLPETKTPVPAKVEAAAPIKPDLKQVPVTAEVPNEKSPEVKKPEVKEEKPTASGSAKA